MKLLRADLRSEAVNLTLLDIRNLETSRHWTNDPSAVIAPDTHLAYIAARLGPTAAEDRVFVYLVLDDGETVVGYQRYDVDKEDPSTWLVSTAFGPAAQGKGYGTRSMGEAIDQLDVDLTAAKRPLARVYAWIHPDNIPSIKMCERSGFARTERTMTDKAGRQMDLYECPVPRPVTR